MKKGEEGRRRVRTVGIKRGITGEANGKSWKKEKNETRGKVTAMEVGVSGPERMSAEEHDHRRRGCKTTRTSPMSMKRRHPKHLEHKFALLSLLEGRIGSIHWTNKNWRIKIWSCIDFCCTVEQWCVTRAGVACWTVVACHQC